MEIICPACRKANQPADGAEAECTRCGCDLENLLAIAQAAEARLQDACDALRAGRPELALEHADRSWSLRRSPQAAALAALAAAGSADEIAVECWRRRWAGASA